jgi:hypothetical protein
MLKLVKEKNAEWLGNGFGCSSAEWVVKGHEHIAVRKLANRWFAIDTNKNAKIASSFDKAHLIEVLSLIDMGARQ